MTHPTLEDAAEAAAPFFCASDRHKGEHYLAARAVLLSIRPPDREDLSLRQLEVRDFIDGILKERA